MSCLAAVAWAVERDAHRMALAAPPEPAGTEQTLDVFTGHPRLMVGGYRGPSKQVLRAACAAPEMQGGCDAISTGPLSDAMRYLLFDDAAAAGRVKGLLLSGVDCGDAAEHTEAGGFALAYDWIGQTVVNPAEKARIEGSLATCGQRLVDNLTGNGPHLWHGFTSQASALALVALALDQAPQRDALRQSAITLFRQAALEGIGVTGGAWPEGYNYTRSHLFSADPPEQFVLDAVRAWDSSVRQDTPAHPSLVEGIAADQGDWLRGLGYFYLYGTLDAYGPGGKRTLLRQGDMPTGQIYPNKQIRPILDAVAKAYDDGVLKGWGEAVEADWGFIGGTGSYHPIHVYGLPLNLPVGVASQPPSGLPLGRVWGRDDAGVVLARSAWDPGETTLAFRAGKWMTGHQHMDQGHIELWRKGPLAVDAGVYARWGTRHREGYYIRSVAHNTLLIRDPAETFDEYPDLGLNINDGGQRIHTYASGGCPQCMQSVAEWRSNVGDKLHFEAATLDAFEEGGDYLVATSDLTSAYNSTRYTTPGNRAKVSSVQRDIAFLRPEVLLVVDRVAVESTARAPQFVLHFPAKPQMPDLEQVAGTSEDGILRTLTSRFQMDNGTGGRLYGRTLVPEAVTATILGGSRYRYWADGANQLDGALSEEGPPAEPGTWRLEVQPNGSGPAFLMVHALTATDTGSPEPASTVLVAEPDPAAPAALAVQVGGSGGWLALFSSQIPRVPLQWASVDAPDASRLLAIGLEPGAEYRLSAAGTGAARFTADAEGVLPADLGARGQVVFGRCPPPQSAGVKWIELCREPPTATPSPSPTPIPSLTPEHPSVAPAWLPAVLKAGRLG